MYPTIVIVLVTIQRSMADICEIGQPNARKLASPVASEARAASLGPFSLAVRPTDSAMDSEAESLTKSSSWVSGER